MRIWGLLARLILMPVEVRCLVREGGAGELITYPDLYGRLTYKPKPLSLTADLTNIDIGDFGGDILSV